MSFSMYITTWQDVDGSWREVVRFSSVLILRTVDVLDPFPLVGPRWFTTAAISSWSLPTLQNGNVSKCQISKRIKSCTYTHLTLWVALKSCETSLYDGGWHGVVRLGHCYQLRPLLTVIIFVGGTKKALFKLSCVPTHLSLSVTREYQV